MSHKAATTIVEEDSFHRFQIQMKNIHGLFSRGAS